MNTAAKIRAAKLAGSQRLNFSCGLKEFPVEIYELADTLEILDLSGNDLSSLPDDFSRLHKLRVLFCSDNQFTHLPEVLGKCLHLSMVGFKSNKISIVPATALGKSLRWLILTDNKITELPAEIGLCTQLQKLMLSGNQLQTLPNEMAACTSLELIRIAANRFSRLPDWLFNLPRLSWLAYAGNPCSEHSESIAQVKNPVTEIPWQQLELQHKLGEGASGVIHQASWQHAPDVKMQVAVKIFKGSITSDGLPQNEKNATISAGKHPNLINVHGKIHQHPTAATGLIMSLIPATFCNLAGPPSLDSCTRDIYADDTIYTLDVVLRIATGIASAAQQLHSKGIMHGDLYAHNILHNDAGECLLGDFGAASFYATENQQQGYALQRIEVRAFGCLLEELLERCDERETHPGIFKELIHLQQNCFKSTPSKRPLFNEILLTLNSHLTPTPTPL